MQDLLEACTKRGVSDLCARSEDLIVSSLGTFDACDDSGLSEFRDDISTYNSKCGAIGFPREPTDSPFRAYFYFQDCKISMDDCFKDNHTKVITFFLFSVHCMLSR
jgi:hypothetical protein